MNSKTITIIVVVVLIAFAKVAHKTNWLKIGGFQSEKKEVFVKPGDIKDSVKGLWKSRGDKTYATIDVQGEELILKRDESEKRLAIKSIITNGIVFDDSHYLELAFPYSKDAIRIMYDLQGAESITLTDYYDRVENQADPSAE